MSKLTVALCEGPHDTAFVARILICNGFGEIRLPLKNYPEPINKFLINWASNSSVGDLRLDVAKYRLIPEVALESSDKDIVLLYALGGDGKKELRNNLVKGLLSIAKIPTDENEIAAPLVQKLRLLYFFDADEKGEKTRMNEISEEVAELSGYDVQISDACPMVEVNGIEYGGYIFRKSNEDRGALEDVLYPLMKQGNEVLFTEIENFHNRHFKAERTYKIKIKRLESGEFEEKKGGCRKHNHYKAMIGIAGQLQICGASNTAHIRESDYLTLEKLINSNTCRNISKLFR